MVEKHSITFWASFLLVFIFSSCQPSGIRVTELHTNYLENPIAIEPDSIVLGWKLGVCDENARNKEQSAYQILVASDSLLLSQGIGDLWDSGKVYSSQSQQIVYRGKELEPRQRVYWKVRVWDEKEQESKWSAIANWAIGLKPDDWQALWISNREDDSPFEATVAPAPFFRKDFEIAKKVKEAKAYVCGLGFYEMYISGDKIGDQVLAPAVTNYDKRTIEHILYPYDDQSNKRVLYNTFDVTSHLKKGKNVLGVILGNGWYNQRGRTVEGCMWYDTPRLLLQLEITYQDGTKEVIVSDESWKCTTGPLVSDGIFTGEVYDARKELDGWNLAGYDDSLWQKVIKVRSPEGELHPQTAPYDKVLQTFQPELKEQINDSTYKYVLPKMVSGWAALNVSGNAGDYIKLRFISEEGTDFGQSDMYILKGAEKEGWEPRFTWHAFREIEVISPKVRLDAQSMIVKAVHTDMDETGTFLSSDTILNSIYHKYVHTQKINLHGSLSSDCPHRERLAYTGDGQILVESLLYTFDCTGFLNKWLDDIFDAQNHKTGYVPHTAPFGGGGGGPAWGSASVIMPWAYYCQYGDVSVLSRHYEGMKHWNRYLGTRLDDRGIVVKEEPDGWCLGDWCTPDKIELPEPLVNTAYYYHVTELLSEIARILDKTEDEAYFDALASQIKQDFNSVFFDEERNTYWEGRQGANVFPLAFGLVPTGKKEKVLETLLQQIESLDYHFDTGILATPLLLKVLTENNHSEVAYKLMTQRSYPSFGYYIMKDEYSCLWEEWNGNNSRCHPMFGSVVAWFYNTLLGIRYDPERPGMKHFIISPHPVGDLTFCKGSYRSLYGLIKSEWKVEKDHSLSLKVEIPVNTTATLLIPEPYTTVLESGTSEETNTHSLTLGSGVYHFSMK
ncbi:family 78 glycoside hydrolase catalytic domain [Bacteroides sp.]